MQAKIPELKVSFFFMNTNFDGTNITVPLVNYLQFYPDLSLQYDRLKETNIILNSNVGILHDSYLGQSPLTEDNLSFYQLNDHFSSEYARAD